MHVSKIEDFLINALINGLVVYLKRPAYYYNYYIPLYVVIFSSIMYKMSSDSQWWLRLCSRELLIT